MQAKTPRFITNYEVLEVVKARHELHGLFPIEDLAEDVDLLFSSLKLNLLNRGGKVCDNLLTDAAQDDQLFTELTFEKVKTFLKRIETIEVDSGVKLLPSEKLQLINIRPDNENVVKLVREALHNCSKHG